MNQNFARNTYTTFLAFLCENEKKGGCEMEILI